MNKAILIGNLTKDPDQRVTGGGTPVTSFTVAITRRYQSAQGEKQADFIPIVTWRTLAENCGKYLRKGSKVAVFGTIQTRSYDAQDGSKRYVTEVVADEVQFLDSKPAGESGRFSQPSGSDMPAHGFTELEDEELPF
ncbi:MAG: single-stranded DNA-binding protein [Christensenellales bacterium]|jgi:single-strand DNA-binding protein